MKGHEHKYISGTIGDECGFCGLLKSTIDSIEHSRGDHADDFLDREPCDCKEPTVFEEINNIICNAQLRERKMTLEIINSLRYRQPADQREAGFNDGLSAVEQKIRQATIFELNIAQRCLQCSQSGHSTCNKD